MSTLPKWEENLIRDIISNPSGHSDSTIIAALTSAVHEIDFLRAQIHDTLIENEVVDYRPREEPLTEQDRREQQAREQYGWA